MINYKYDNKYETNLQIIDSVIFMLLMIFYSYNYIYLVLLKILKLYLKNMIRDRIEFYNINIIPICTL